MRAADGQHAGEIGGAVGAGFVGPKVQTHRHCAARMRREPGRDCLGAFIVKAKAVDHRAVFGQAKEPGLWVARLRQRGGRANLDKAKARLHQSAQRRGVLVVPGCKADRVG